MWQPWASILLIPSGVQIRFDRRTLVGETRGDVLDAIAGALATVDAVAFDVTITADPLSAYTGIALDAPRWLPAWRTDPAHWLALAASEAAPRATAASRTGGYDFCTHGS